MQLISWESSGLAPPFQETSDPKLELSPRSYPRGQIFPSKFTITHVCSTEGKSNEPILGWVAWVGPCPVWTRLAFRKLGQGLVYLECEDSSHGLPVFLQSSGSLEERLLSP